ncbi:ParB/RepB/Spo0J family partition protein [Allomesorhizobium camelthorni]|uniref:ParB/RepB/Spo0J family partition protein n=1 Tax=Allomesorhizobium camelthorni TaxID=475069 RepID=UPI001FE5DED9|nr:ParB/RepB/Spo0J family partition protein [Mesorhizobium camelthorni]
MQLAHIDLGKLTVSPFNMRDGKRAPDIADILPSIRQRGIVQPLLVRENGSPDTFEIVAGGGATTPQ